MEICAVILLIAATVLVHGFGTYALVGGLLRESRAKWRRASIFRLQFVLARVVLAIFALHLLEAAIWAAFYSFSGALPDFRTALYFSLASYTTVGYGDVVLGDQWRLLGVFEACIGVLMLGWSTGILFALVSRQFEGHLHVGERTEQL
jgi:voltage-gated potassium channel